jgi:hypothetical protein
MVSNMIKNLETILKENPSGPINFRELFKDELFQLALKEVGLIKLVLENPLHTWILQHLQISRYNSV